ncbi:fimbrial protein [Erwinia billingiae]|uniref:fimbrial protein n=1 Tax=Erwinia billingiae TaxID=182337 RepID=UPI0032092039
MTGGMRNVLPVKVRRRSSEYWASFFRRMTKMTGPLIFMGLCGLPNLCFGAMGVGISHPPLTVGECPAGSENLAWNSIENVCEPDYASNASGVYMVGAGGEYKPGEGTGTLGHFVNTFAAVAGTYSDRVYICPTETANRCTIAASDDHIDGAATFFVNTTVSIDLQNIIAGGSSVYKKVPYSFSFCQVLVDKNGVEWGSTDATSCSDAKLLPDQPAACTLNAGESLDVKLGQLERAAITTSPTKGAEGNVRKSVAVVCTGDLAANVITQFQYTPVTVNGNQVVATTNSNLGVAILYQGKVVSPTDQFNEKWPIGTKYSILEFEAVRDPAVATKDIATGDFSACVVMVMTQQ